MRSAVLVLIALTFPAATARGLELPLPVSETAGDEQVVKAAGLSAESAALLDFFRGRGRAESDRGKLQGLVRKLADPAAEVRDQAAGQLLAAGAPAIPFLRHAINDLEDPDLGNRARRCLQHIEGSNAVALTTSAIRLLAVRQPAGTAEVLLAYLPMAEDPSLIEQVSLALAAVAFKDNRPEPALLRALEDPSPIRRGIAAEALCRLDGTWPRDAVAKLLRDPRPTVRLRAALALARQNDGEAVPVLIDLVSVLPPPERQMAEDYLGQLAAEWSPGASLAGDDEVSRRIRRDAWAAWWRNTDGPALLEEFRKRTLQEKDRARVEALVKQLDDPSVVVREKAGADLQAIGTAALPLLRQASKASESDQARRAEYWLRRIEKDGRSNLSSAAPRLVALRKPAGAVEVLLAYLPWADDESVHPEIQNALAAVALQDGKLDPALVRALEDPAAVRRTVAAEVLCRIAATDQRAAVRKLLQDREATVRLRVGLALTSLGDREAVPPLIALLTELPPEQCWQIEDYLQRLAGDKAPKTEPGTDAAGRAKYRDAWAGWWKENGAKIDMVRLHLADRLLGYTFMVQMDDNGMGRAIEIGGTGKPRWQIDGLQFPVNGQVLRDNRVLIAEYNGNRVTERDFKGNIIWQKQVGNSVVNTQRLPNGNTFIATRNQLLEVTPDGKEVVNHTRQGHDIQSAVRLRNGQFVLITSGNQCVRLDANGKELKSFGIAGQISVGGMDVLANGRILVALYNNSKVVEYDASGKQLWEASVSMPSGVSRLPNGNTLVGSYNSSRLVEVDRAGKVIWEHKDGFRVWKARRR